MIFETQREKEAFDFICKLASESMSRNGCNDLSREEVEIFGMLKKRDSDGIERPVMYDFDVLFWLQNQVKCLEDVREKND